MAIAPQTAMPNPPVRTRPQPAPPAGPATTGPSAPPIRQPAASPQARASRHALVAPMPEPSIGSVVIRLAALVLATAFVVGGAGAIALALLTGTLTQLGH